MEHRELDEQQRRKELLEHQTKLYGAMYDKAGTYTNLITALGYAGFFGLWSLTKPYLTERQALWTASFMLVSLAVFVLFEVYKAAVTGVATQRRAKVLFDADPEPDIETLVSRFQDLELENTKDVLRVSRIWPFAWGTAVIFGFAAIGTLLFSFVCGLMNE